MITVTTIMITTLAIASTPCSIQHAEACSLHGRGTVVHSPCVVCALRNPNVLLRFEDAGTIGGKRISLVSRITKTVVSGVISLMPIKSCHKYVTW